MRLLPGILWQRTLIGKRLVWKASVTRNRDGGSNPSAVVMPCSSVGITPDSDSGDRRFESCHGS